ncbi:MAG: hypothetical protein CMH83_05830 [Nocardioides sp.]|nr:hypothetical protein [Nocardioides sp.]
MSDFWEAWFLGGDAYDRNTRHALEQQRASEARARSHLAAQMRRNQGDLQAQVDRLTEAFVAMVEHEDVRGELIQHSDAAAVRRVAREVVSTYVVTGSAASVAAPVPDVAGYWLVPAARSLAAGPGTDEGRRLLDEAVALDRRRSLTLRALVAAVRGEDLDLAVVDEVVPHAGETSGDVTHAQRLVWQAVAEGRLGDAALARLEEHLSGERTSVADALVERVTAQVGSHRIAAEAAVQATERLAVLATTAAEGAEVPEAEAPRDTGLVAAFYGLPGDRVRDAEKVPVPAEDPLSDCLRALVDEGAPGEAQILSRMTEIRTRMGLLPEQPDQRWDRPVGSVDALLVDDLCGNGGGPGARALALRVAARPVRAAAERLREGTGPAGAARTTVRLPGATVEVGPDGAADDGWRAAVERRAREDVAVSPALLPAAVGAAVLGLVLLVLGVLSPGWAVLGVVVLLVAGGMLLGRRHAVTSGAEDVVARLRRADREVADTRARAVDSRDADLAREARARTASEQVSAATGASVG